MAFDGFFTYKMNSELKERLQEGRINKIYQPSPYELVFLIRANRQNHKLFLSIHPTQARYHLTSETYFYPEMAPNFCMLLRKHLEGAILKDIQQVSIDRITTFVFQNRNEMGDLTLLHLTVELMNKHSNIFLVNPFTNIIIDSMKHVPISQNSYRTLRPNSQYALPPYQQKINFINCTQKELEQITQKLPDISKKIVQQTFQGIGSSTWQYLQQKLESMTLSQALIQLASEPLRPSLTAQDFYPFFMENAQYFDSLGELLDTFFSKKANEERVRQLAGNLVARLQQLKNKNEHKLIQLSNDLVKTDKMDDYRIKGELLTANLYAIQKGMESVEVVDFYNDNQLITIPLSPQKTPNQNAQDYFKRYQKLKQSIQHIEEQQRITQEDINYIDSVLTHIQMSSHQELLDIYEELAASGYIKRRQQNKRKKQHKISQPIHYVTNDGTSIYVGKNNLQNDQLTLKTAKKTDIWLHAKNIPGSHVIIASDTPSDETLETAAKLAAYYSAFQQSSNVPVDYIQVKHIRKPNGSKPGFVVYEGQKTMIVSPIKEEIEQLTRIN